jgi:uncharacterized protein (DUF2236 family)
MSLHRREKPMSAAQIPLPAPLLRWLDTTARDLMQPSPDQGFDFACPAGEPALAAADSLSWRIFKNPATLFIGGVAAVILELAEPGVRSGVWNHSSFRTEPVRRLQRTGLAAMITVYGARSRAEAMIAGITRLHDQVQGRLPDGRGYHASDPALLRWVQATASFGFAEAYHRYANPLGPEELDRLYIEALPAAHLYGADDAPRSDAERRALFAAMDGRLEASPVIQEFLRLMHQAPVLPGFLRKAQHLLVRAAVDITPDWLRARLGLGTGMGLRPWQAPLVRRICTLADRVLLPSSPPVQACLRLGLPPDYLFRR